jgi:hypothetical protein
MKIQTTLLLLAALGFTSPLMARGDSIEEVAHQSGLTIQQVRMLIGARTPYPAYRTSYDRLRKQLIASVGQRRYQELVLQMEQQTPGHTRTSAG